MIARRRDLTFHVSILHHFRCYRANMLCYAGGGQLIDDIGEAFLVLRKLEITAKFDSLSPSVPKRLLKGCQAEGDVRSPLPSLAASSEAPLLREYRVKPPPYPPPLSFVLFFESIYVHPKV